MTESDEDVFSCYEESEGSKPSNESVAPTGLRTESSFEFLTVSELADATSATLPPHNYVRTLGVCGGRNLDVLYLAEVKRPSATVSANFDCTGTFPAMKSTVEAFGRVDFKRRGATVAPELVVWFFRELCGNSTAYADVCLKLRARRPRR